MYFAVSECRGDVATVGTAATGDRRGRDFCTHLAHLKKDPELL